MEKNAHQASQNARWRLTQYFRSGENMKGYCCMRIL